MLDAGCPALPCPALPCLLAKGQDFRVDGCPQLCSMNDFDWTKRMESGMFPAVFRGNKISMTEKAALPTD
jgi:hypothetical protein